MPIHVLPPEVASQIAAGEVVERPASVVKELIENALDAGAGYITITVEGAGQRLIEVSDDGSGIPPEELLLAVERHATSKLNRAEDIFNVRTLGFRGEALASIGSVSILTLTSRLANREMGARLRVEGGHTSEVTPAGAPPGSTARVENLFYNVPARLKFLKREATERAQIDALVTRYALAYPNVRFHLLQEGKPALQTSGNGDRRQVLAALYGAEIARQMLEVSADYDEVRITGFISPLSLTRSNRREITFFVNGRPMHDSSLTAAMLQAYHSMLMVGRYPMGVLFIEILPELVDVNVHPTKAEVRFRNQDQVFNAVQRAVRRALLAYTPAPGLDLQPRWSLDSQAQVPYPGSRWEDDQAESGTGPADFGDQGQTTDLTASEFSDPIRSSQAGLPSRPMPLLRLVGQVATTYVIAEGPDGLYLIDQHAAHERILFEHFMAQRDSQIASQALLQPAAVDLAPASARLLTEQLSLLQKIGFEVEPFGPVTFLVRSVPALLANIDPAAALRSVVEDFEEDETPLEAEIEAKIIARVCKRAAVKAGQTLSPDEQRALLLDLEACRAPRTCPHGRPTMIHLSVDLLEKQFGRRGAR
jgi:DNA mismatch repair protein MutL